MKQINQEKFRSRKNKYLFGSTAAIITNMGLVVGLLSSLNAKVSIISSILIIAVADNISDTLGIHIYQEAEGLSAKEVWLSSFTNFTSRFIVSLMFILLILALPLKTAAVCCLILGLFIISFNSYFIAVHTGKNPYLAVLEHIGVAAIVIILSKALGNFVISQFKY
jgi:VIT1/CCC1 family predicted Fe2+/Mn2+ transporter